LYPGMCDDSLEIFFHPEEQSLKAIHAGRVKCFTQVPAKDLSFLKEIMNQEPETRKALAKMHPGNEQAQVEQLAKCRFGGLNFAADYCHQSKQSNFDYIECSIRKECPGC